MKKVAVLCNYMLLPDRIGGMDYFFWGFDDAIKKEGYTVDWFFPNAGEHGQYGNLAIKVSGTPSVEDSFLHEVRTNNRQYDFIYCHFLELCTPFFKKIKSLLPAVKIIAVDHNPRPIGGYPLKKRIEKRLKGLLYARYLDYAIGVSKYTVTEIVRDFGNPILSKTSVIYNGIITASIEKRKNRNTLHPSFLTACHLRSTKGIQDLIIAVSLLPDSIKNNLLIDVYGDGDFKAQLLTLVKENNLQQQFSFKGNSSQLGSVYYKYDYLIHPSHMECFSLGLLESLAANVPVITTPVGGNTEIIKNNINGFLFPTQNVEALSNLLGQLYLGTTSITLETDELVKEKFTLQQMITQYLLLLK